ncbi:helix-turn-helix domain-containing protein [Trichococcus sp. K1Tr]|uniref:helix-turn-helix domain-containing protein n=1 Tax=Trichococcus sp. K1Tr TaxID=3020847 RepID=UPI00232C62BB|nr:HTH domain-containing protein [Trichococcus sp. K1Tr]MDB6353893.1 helix-turn-helix domain-containing protein [Trichococcus sp. K1Tr]
MFTQRQSKLLIYLLNLKDWVKTKELAAFLNVGSKTVLKEINSINEINQNDLFIEYVRNKGFRFKNLSDQMKEQIIQTEFEKENFHTLKDSPIVFILYLIFMGKEVSLQNISDTFYMSKTSVAKEFSIVKRWIKRTKGLTLEKNRLGFKIVGEERYKRIYISNIIHNESLKKLMLEQYAEEEYQKYLSAITRILRDFLINNHIFISDMDFNRVSKYIVISILRSKAGALLEFADEMHTTQPVFMDELISEIKNELDYLLSNFEASEIENLINIFSMRTTDFINQAEYALIQKKLRTIAEPLHAHEAHGDKNETITDEVVRTLSALKRKQKLGITSLNLLNDEIIKKYLFAAHHTYLLFKNDLKLSIDKELSRIVLLINLYIDELSRKGKNILLVSKSNMEVLENIKYKFEVHQADAHVHYLPQYFLDDGNFNFGKYNIFITTEDEITVRYPFFELMDAIPSDENISLVFLKDQKQSEERIQSTMSKIEFTEMHVAKEESARDILDEIEAIPSDFASKFTIHGNELLILYMQAGLKQAVKKYVFEKEISIENQSVQKVYLVSCDEDYPSKQEFFQAVTGLIK